MPVHEQNCTGTDAGTNTEQYQNDITDKAGTATPTAASALAHTPASTSAATFMNRAET